MSPGIPDWMSQFIGNIRTEVPMNQMCWFGVGGKARFLFKPQNLEQLQAFIKAKPKDFEIITIGVGSNLLIRDGGVNACIIRLGREFNYIYLEGENIIAGASTLDLNVALYAAENSRAGLEFLVGIPGTVGGAIAMNAGAYGNDIGQILVSARAVDENGEIIQICVDDFRYHYRGHMLNKKLIFIEGTFITKSGDNKIIIEKMEQIKGSRESTQPIRTRTSGSTFKNPKGHSAWKLIEDAGCKGMSIGGAIISEQHCNFLINYNNATAHDIESLIKYVRQKVWETSQIELEVEIQIFGIPF